MAGDARVLLVEDDDTLRLDLRDYLQQRGYRVLVASDGVGAIKHLLDEEVDLVVTDYRMATFGGEYWIRFLQTFCPTHPVLVTSAFLKHGTAVPFPMVPKPYAFADLEQHISEILAAALPAEEESSR
ncbi:Response regulator receiver domain-containing protein [Alkalispirochaeta americana]|uniref:Response regulator receiver domain-containing protein n=1 Tax=Alkalispirochaeta americana TaxID=159291 RepID=A0A1N6N482_9SPIO|nr:response regulator [Alkalispirochaeta americana]SIP86862.1 Response regulator receiver domain-containing protein [Alkalispirochaeta americana]